MKRCLVSTFSALLFFFPSWSSVAGQPVPEGHSVPINGFEMYYETLGEGEPLLLVHGWSGNSDYFGPLLRELAGEFFGEGEAGLEGKGS
jgi:hypothetical protein